MNIAQYMLAAAERSPDAIALTDEMSALTFSELRARSEALAVVLLARGLKPGDAVAIVADRSCAVVVAMHAVLLCGAVYCPLDIKAPPGRIRTMLDRLAPSIILRSGATSAELNDTIVVDIPGKLPQDQVDECARSLIHERVTRTIENDAAYVIFTSGSTGEPKGVTIAHGGVRNYIEWARDFTKLGPSDVIAGQAPFHFDNSVLDVYLTMAAGAALDIFPTHIFTFPLRLAERLLQRGTTFIFWVPSALAGIASSGWLDAHALPALRHVVFAGEVMPPAALARWMTALPQARFSNLYGPTEITVDCTWYDVPGIYAGEPVPIGFPLPNTEIQLVDEHDRPVKEGEVGEMLVRGSGVALGYWNRPDLTAAAFVQNPRQARYIDRAYRTGDLAYRDVEGCLHFVGRRDNQIKRRGYRVELGEIEYAIDGAPGITASAVVFDARRDRLVMYAVSAAPLDLASIRKYLKDKLSQYMLPDELVQIDTLPLSPSGKIDRKSLLSMLNPSND